MINVVFLIGNGFDLKLGLKTRYADFYQWYKKQERHSNPNVQKFRDEINPTLELWSDLEVALGKYLKNITDVKDGVLIYNDVVGSLKNYIAIQNTKQLTPVNEDESFFRQFFYPFETFQKASRRKISEFVNFNDHIETRLIVFNYTTTLERLLDWQGNPLKFALGNFSTEIKAIEHIHGYCDDRGRLALGVDSAEQIANKALIEHNAIINRFVKPAFNDACELEHHLPCLQWINEGDVIFIFGLSLGETDKTWWKAIARRMKENAHGLLFIHLKKEGLVTTNMGPEYHDEVEQDKEWVLQRMGLEETPNICPRIFITYSEKCFAFQGIEKIRANKDEEIRGIDYLVSSQNN